MTPEGPAVSVGSIVASRYELRALLGRGGMGVVYRAYDRFLDEEVALKLLLAGPGSAGAVKRFKTEIKLARKVRHRNVCAIHEYNEFENLLYISTELVEGIDLTHFLRAQGPLGANLATDIVAQIAAGLHAIHQAGIVHRDLKPSNVMRTSGGLVKLLDFGIAKDMDSATMMTAAGEIVGTPHYMSPEQARSERATEASDIYSLGVLTFQLLTGTLPFIADTPIGVILKHQTEPPDLDGLDARRVPAEAKALIKQALAKDRAERPQVALEFAQAFTQAMGTEVGNMPTIPGFEVTVPPSTTPRSPMTVTAEAENAATPPSKACPPESHPSQVRPHRHQPPPATRPRYLRRPAPSARPRGPVGVVSAVAVLVVIAAAGIGTWRARRTPVTPPERASRQLPLVRPTLTPAPILDHRDERAGTPTPQAITVASPEPTSIPLPPPAPPTPTPAPAAPPSPTPDAQAAPVAPPSPTPEAQTAPVAPPVSAPEAKRMGRLRITIRPPARLFVDGEDRGEQSLLELEHEAGQVVVEVQHRNYFPIRQVVQVLEGQRIRLNVDFLANGQKR